MDSAGTVEVGGPTGCLHGDFGRDLTNASGQAQHSLAQGGSCWYSEHLLWGDSLYLVSWVATDIHFIFNVIFSPRFYLLSDNCWIVTDAEYCLPGLR